MQTTDLQIASLSKEQLLHWKWQQANQIYGSQARFLLEGTFELERFRQAFCQSAQRHEILCTTFSVMPGMELPMQVLGRCRDISIPFVNLQALELPIQQSVLAQQWQRLLLCPFDLEHGPLLYALLFRLNTAQHVLLLRMSPLCADVSTLKFFVEDVLQDYGALLQDHALSDNEDILQYIDIISWQNDLLASEGALEQQKFWSTFDLSHLAAIHLPFKSTGGFASLAQDSSTPPAVPFQKCAIPLEQAWQQRLWNFSQSSKLSLESYLLTCWQILLWRLMGTSPLIGVACDGRSYEELATVIGPYTRTLPFSLSLDETITFDQALAETSLALQEMSEKQLYFNWEGSVSNDAQEEHIFPISFALNIWPQRWQAAGSLTVSLQYQESWREPSQVHLQVTQIGEQLQIDLLYLPSAFSQLEVLRLANCFRMLLQGALSAPQTHVATLPLLTHEEQAQQQARWRGPEYNWSFVPLHRRFQVQAQRHPMAPAVRWGDVLLSYQQVETLSNQLAHWLLTHGLRPGGRVALYQERSHWAIISLLGVLKAGGCYVPLDEQIPTSRLHLLLEALAPSAILTSSGLRQHLPSTLSVPILMIGETSQSLSGLPELAPQVEVRAQDLAYVMYTSGSTGLPKGVLISQGSVSNYTQSLCDLLELEAGWHFGTVSSLAADLGNTAIFCGLASGGCVHVLPYTLVTDGAAFSRYVGQYPLDVLKIVPSHLQALLASGAVGVVPRWRLVLGGEALSWSLVEQLHALGGSCQLYNHYGPTEATIGTLVQPLGSLSQIRLASKGSRSHSVPLGHPLPQTRLCLLDGQRQPVPQGVVAELYLGGAGLAAGYLGDEEQTRARFVEIEEASSVQRWYRTGDLVRENERGALEFMGRQDRQAKLRGYRVELGEIEAQLKRHPAVREAVVQLLSDPAGESTLIGYLIPWKKPGPGLEEIKAALRQDVPAYLVPPHLQYLEQLPLTANGKLDYRRLPEPSWQPEEETKGTGGEAASTLIEEVMMGVWQEVLGLQQIGRSENFFVMGGHSLLGTRMIARLRTLFGVEVPIRWLFDAPSIAGLSRCIEEALRQAHGMPLPPLVAVSREQWLPLSFAQQRLWFLDQLEPGSAAYNVPRAVRLQGGVDEQALEQALRALMQRHESLRTTFPSREGEPVQQIAPEPVSQLTQVDLRGVPEPQREEEARRLAQQEGQQPFDLERGPLIRTWLVRLEQHEHLLVLTMHHIISDGWSSAILEQELSDLYTGFASGVPVLLPALAIQYADYAYWQRSWLQGEALEKQLDYWRENLAGLAPLTMPTDHPRPAIQTFRGEQQQVYLSAELSQQLRALSQREGVTLFMTLLAAFDVLLARYSGQGDLTVGTPIANRTYEEIEGIIGCFVNTLVLRTDLSDNPVFEDLLARVRETALGAYTHQDVPFEQVVEALHPERDRSRSPLFQVFFALQNTSNREVLVSQTSSRSEEFVVEQHVTKFDLSLVVAESGQELQTTLEYNTDLFESATIARLLSHWRHLLEGIVANSGLRTSELPLLTEWERAQILGEWNATERQEPEIRSIQRRFEEQVEDMPDAVALVFEELHLSYAELNRRANQVASMLRELNVGPEVLVALFLERSLEQVIGVLGVLKAGGAYVPLDPGYPQERLSFLLSDARPAVLLTQERLKEMLPPSEAYVFSLDGAEQVLLARQSCENPRQITTTENLAYVIYTSGSTGKPKGVQIMHGAVANLLQAMKPLLGVPERAVVPAMTTLAFDIAVTELWLPLLWGGRSVLVSREIAVDGKQLAELLTRVGATIVQATPATWQILLASSWRGSSDMRLLCTGEALPRSLADQLLERGKDLWNLYGPTETTIWSTGGQVDVGAEVVWIGRPIENTQLYVLDAHQQPVPIGVAGELYIGGRGVGRGYLHRAELTAERFVPHPFSQQRGARLYRTGDQVRYRADGVVEYLGRIDSQVKLRGYRIELGEIEAVLDQHPQVKQSVVVLKGKETQEKHLVAYVVGEAGADFVARGTGELRSYLKGKLSEYMLPAHIVSLDALPLTPNGKVDRRSLLDLRGSEMELGDGEKKSDLGPVEELVQQVWQQVLSRAHVGIQENFFEIGGHSLLATQVIARLRRTLGVEIPLRVLFEASTVQKLAVQILHILQQDQGLQAPAMRTVPRDRRLPLSFAQQRMWLLDQLEPGNTAYIIPMAMRLRGGVNRIALEQALRAVMQRHESLRTTFPSREGEPVQQIAPEPASQLVWVDLMLLHPQLREREASRLAQQEVQQPFDLATGPLVRCWLLRIEDEDQVLVLTMHHIISDGWSMGILVRELSGLYIGLANGTPTELPSLPIQYADYAYWQRSWLQGEILQKQLDYWKEQLTGLTFLELPTDRPRPAIQRFRGAQEHVQFSARMSQDLYSLSQQEGVTLFMTLLAALQVLLTRYSGQEDFAIGTPIANRTREEVEGLIGFFLNTLVLRSDLVGNPTFVELLARVRAVTLGAYTHQDVPFEQVVEALQPERDRSRSPFFQVLFQLQNIPSENIAVRPTSLQMEGFSVERHTAQLDLRMIVIESEQGLQITLEYNIDLFAQATIQRLLEHFRTLLEGIVSAPTQHVWSLPLLSPTERHALLTLGNLTRCDDVPGGSFGELFAQQVASTPHRIAVCDQHGYLTYSALWLRAQRLARQLADRGVGPEILVAVALSRSTPWLVSVLAIWQCGGVYVPLDPAVPAQRLHQILEQARPSLLISTLALKELLPADVGQVLFLEHVESSLTFPGQPADPVPNLPQQLAYVIYTSGSTGQPKGAMVTQESMVNHLWAKITTLHLDDQDAVGQTASQSFDISLWQLLAVLLQGGRVQIIPDAVSHDPTSLLQMIAEQGISILQVVPSWLSALLEDPRAHYLKDGDLRWLSVTGEAMPAALCERWWKEHEEVSLLNAYGPTECSDDVSHAVLVPEQKGGRVPIGRPIHNTQLYALDEWMEPVPQGVIGEIYVGGKGVGRGYLDDAGKTAQAFVPDPFGQTGGARLYRTGDRGRVRTDGQWEFVERRDEQVKVRGYRIELGEIETVLSREAVIRQCAVVLKEGVAQEKVLVAYVVQEQGAQSRSIELAELGKALKGKLPDYMIPAHFVLLDALPLTPNGKVDRRELAALPLDVEASAFVAYRDSIEYQLRDIWSELLGIHPISIMDNFFELGGHSILAARLMARIKQAFDREFPLAVLFQFQTVAELAVLIREQLPHVEDSSAIVPFQIHGKRIPFFCIHPSGGDVYEYRNLSRYLGTAQPFYGIRMPDPRKHSEEFRTVEGIAAYYLVAIRELQPQGPYQLGGWSAGGLIAYEMAQQLRRQGQEVRLLALIDSYVPVSKREKVWKDQEIVDDATIVRALMERYQVTLPQELAEREKPEAQLVYVCEQLKQRNIAPPDIRLEQIRFFALVRETIGRAVRCYTPQLYNGGSVTLFSASEREDKIQEYYSEELRATGQISNGWRKLVQQGVDIHQVPGGHTTLVEEPYAKDLATALAQYLASEQD